MCERCYEILNYEYKMLASTIESLGEEEEKKKKKR